MLWLLINNLVLNIPLALILTVFELPWVLGSWWIILSWNSFYIMNVFFDILFYPYYLVVEAYSVSEAMASRPLYNAPTN